MQKFRDGLGHVHEVPNERFAEFERRRGNMLKAAIVLKLMLLTGLIWWLWL